MRPSIGILIALFVASLVLLTTPLATESPIAMFKRDWTGRKVVLVEPLYTIQHSAVDPSSPGRTNTRPVGITIASPDKSTYYYAEPTGNRLGTPNPTGWPPASRR